MSGNIKYADGLQIYFRGVHWGQQGKIALSTKRSELWPASADQSKKILAKELYLFEIEFLL